MVFHLQRYSLHDGDGIRTLIFFKGCPLRCFWCSNPESQSFDAELLFDPRKCIGCQECVKRSQHGEFTMRDGAISLDRSHLTQADIFADVCPAKAITVVGEEMTAQEILAEIAKDELFYQNSGGGVTLSGGEPFAQPGLLGELLQGLKQAGIRTAVETCLHVPYEAIARHVGLIDMFLADVKHVDPELFRNATGGNLQLILTNLRRLDEAGAPISIRIPVIPGFNHSENDMKQILDFIAVLPHRHDVHFMPYHPLGSQKYTLSGRIYSAPASALPEADIQPYLRYAQERGLRAIIGG